MAAYIDYIIMGLVGAWASAVGYGLLPPLGKDPAAQDNVGKLFKVIGPALIGIAVALALAHSFKLAG
jgi:uncharacterized membrane protein YeaQ/YmgE (transglycosylase-associated protein family)